MPLKNNQLKINQLKNISFLLIYFRISLNHQIKTNMKTIIEITGQLGSLFTIRNSFSNYDELITGHYNHYVHLVYNTRESAIEAIENAKNHLLSEDCELRNVSESGFCYDAGAAEIYNESI